MRGAPGSPGPPALLPCAARTTAHPALRTPLPVLPPELLRLKPRYIDRDWGAPDLAHRCGLRPPPTQAVGEVLALHDDRPTNGVDASSELTEPVAGHQSLRTLMRDHAAELLGRARPAPANRFPVRIRWIATRRGLGAIRTMPTASLAGVGGEATGSAAICFLLAAGPEAKLTISGREWPAVADHCVLLPPGESVAFRGSHCFLLVEQAADEPLHLSEQAGADPAPVSRPEHRREPVPAVWEDGSDGLRFARLARSRAFAANLLEWNAPARLAGGPQYRILVGVRGAGRLRPRGSDASWELRTGELLLVPASIPYVYVEPGPTGLTALQILERA